MPTYFVKTEARFPTILETLKNLIRPKAPRDLLDNSSGFINYGPNNDTPIQFAKIVENSPTGISNIDVIQKFITGSGFDSSIQDFKINKEQKFFEFHKELAEQYGLFEGGAAQAIYSADNFKVKSWRALPFHGCRLANQNEDGEIEAVIYNPFMGFKDYKRENNWKLPIFNPDPEMVKTQMSINSNKKAKKEDRFRGQCLYWGNTSITSPFYPRPKYWSAKGWMEVDYLIQEFHKQNINNNFFLGLIMKMVGDPNAPSEDPRDVANEDTVAKTGKKWTKTVGERFEADMQDNFSGATQGGSIMVLWSKVKDQFPEIEPFQNNANHDLFITLSTLTTENISRATKVPPLLANIEQAGSLSDASKIREASELMNKYTEPARKLLEEKYKKMLRAMETPPKEDDIEALRILPFQFFKEDVPPDPIWEAMSLEERRKWIDQNTNIDLLEGNKPLQNGTIVKQDSNGAIN